MAKLLLAYEMVFPGIKFIAVKDYKLINDAPFEARAALAATAPPKETPCTT